MTLYAQWEEIAKVFYTVKFDANGGTGEMNKITAESGIEIAITENSFTKAGWTFSGWNTKSDGTGAPYNDKTKITLTADVILYAQWAAGTGTAYKVEHWQQNITDDDYTLAKTEPMTGTTGEKTAAKAEETAGFTAKEFVQAKIAADGSTVVKIHYDRKIITLTFDADNGGEKTVRSGRFGTEIVPPFPEKTDFNFNGWSTKQTPDESSKSYNDKEKITLTEDLTLYAQWKENPSYSINYNLNEGTNPEDARTSYKQDETIVLPVPTREFYDFAGWHLAQDFSGEVIKGWNAGERTENITLYAKWTVKAENVVNAIKNLPEGTHNICVVGKIDEDTVRNISSALHSNENAKVNLDLSGTSGLESIPESAFSRCIKLVNIKIPASVTSIGDYAFQYCINLTNIAIPASVTSIGEAAFQDCTNLTNIAIPASVTSIGKAAFEFCTNLANIEIPASVTSISPFAFYNCEKLTNIEIPSSIINIGYYAFADCIGLTNVRIPASITTIEFDAFFRCSSLTTVNYMGTIEQWDSISVSVDGGGGNENLTSAKIICTDGVINGD